MIDYRDADFQELSRTSAFSAAQWSDAHIAVRDLFPAQHWDDVWFLVVGAADRLHQKPETIVHMLARVADL